MGCSLPGVGVFGTGISAKATIYLLKSSGFRVEAIWGRTEDEASELAALLDIPFFTSHIDALLLHQRVDLVCINSPPFLQSEIAVKTLGIGKNVLCDRPAGLGFEDTERMLTAARYYPSLMSLMTYYLRFLPTFCEMKKLILSGYIGDMQIVEIRVHCGMSLNKHYGWLHDSRMGAGVLSAFGGHFVDLVTYISGQKATKVHGFLTTFRKNTEKVSGFREITSDDFCTFEMKLDKEACCTCVINNNVPGRFTYEVMAIGSKACLVAKNGVLHGQDRSSSDSERKLLAEDETNFPSGFEKVTSSELLHQIPVPLVQGLNKLIETLKKSFSDEDDRRKWDQKILECAATFEDALYVQNVLECIKKSSKTNYWEQVKTL